MLSSLLVQILSSRQATRWSFLHRVFIVGSVRHFSWYPRVVSIWTSSHVKDRAEREPICWWIWSLLTSLGENFGNVTFIIEGNLVNSSFLHLYLEIRPTSLESKIFVRLVMICVISDIFHVISSSCVWRTARCLESISSRLDVIDLITVSISLCKSSPCLQIAVTNFFGIFLQFSFFKRNERCDILIFRTNGF